MLWSSDGSLPSLVAAVAALRLGAVLVPANPLYTERELAHLVGDVRPTLAVVERPEQRPWIHGAGRVEGGGAHGAGRVEGVGAHSAGRVEGAGAPAASGAPGRPRPAGPGGVAGRWDPADVVVCGPDLRALGPSGPGTPAPGGARGGRPGGGAAVPLDRSRPEDPALIVYTSGTTGAPKGAVLSHANLVAGTEALRLAWAWEPEDRLVLALPLCHVHGLCAGLFGTLGAGASAVVLPRFRAEAVLDAAGRERASLFFGVPTMYHRLLDTTRAAELGRLRLCVSGSAPLPVALWRQVRDRAGVSVLERYGMSETLLTLSNPLEGERRPGTVGLPLPGAEVRIGPPPGGPPKPAGSAPVRSADEGELLVRGPMVFGGYWERPDATAACFTDGWFRTGDIASVDEAGYVSIRARATELVISGGWNVYPAEVEDVLHGCPGVVDVAVTGTPSAEWGEAVTAWVVSDGSLGDPSPLLAFAADRLAAYKRPRVVHFVDALPRNAMGKVVRAELG